MYDRAREVGAEALEAIRGAGDPESELVVLGNLGTVAFRTGRYTEAVERFSAALAAASERGDPVGMLDYIEAIAATAAAMRQPEASARLLGAAEELEAAKDIRLEAGSLDLRAETIASLREALGDPALNVHWQAGQELTLEAAAAEAAQLANDISRVS